VRWNLNRVELAGLVLYAFAFPIGITLGSQHQVPSALLPVVLMLINLPFLVLLSPLLMLSELLHLSQVAALVLAWAVIFAQSYLAFVFLRRRAESAGVGIWVSLWASLGRLAIVSLVTLFLVGLALVLLIRVP